MSFWGDNNFFDYMGVGSSSHGPPSLGPPPLSGSGGSPPGLPVPGQPNNDDKCSEFDTDQVYHLSINLIFVR